MWADWKGCCSQQHISPRTPVCEAEPLCQGNHAGHNAEIWSKNCLFQAQIQSNKQDTRCVPALEAPVRNKPPMTPIICLSLHVYETTFHVHSFLLLQRKLALKVKKEVFNRPLFQQKQLQQRFLGSAVEKWAAEGCFLIFISFLTLGELRQWCCKQKKK